MKANEARALKVGDLLRYKGGATGDGSETLEIVIEEWQGGDEGQVTVQTVAVIKQKQRTWANEGQYYVGDKGFIQDGNFENFEKIK